eukprot:m.73321 g.73321  ORF g.73321 m.73321 type:complete len:328 (-) comp14325_c0_seq1:606-1589(-)
MAEGYDALLRSNSNLNVEELPAESSYTIGLKLVNIGSQPWIRCQLKHESGDKLFDDVTLEDTQPGEMRVLKIEAKAPKYDSELPTFNTVYKLCTAEDEAFGNFYGTTGLITFSGTLVPEQKGFFERVGEWFGGSSEDEDKPSETSRAAPPRSATAPGRGRRREPGRPMARMLHPVNARSMFDPLEMAAPLEEVKSVKVTPALLRAMRLRESELRLTEENQALLVHESVVDVTTRLQQQVAQEFGFEDPEVGVRLMLTAEEVFPEKATELKEASHWRKYNRASQGTVQEGDDVRTMPVAHLSGTTTTLQAYLPDDDTKPCVIAAGSYS